MVDTVGTNRKAAGISGYTCPSAIVLSDSLLEIPEAKQTSKFVLVQGRTIDNNI